MNTLHLKLGVIMTCILSPAIYGMETGTASKPSDETKEINAPATTQKLAGKIIPSLAQKSQQVLGRYIAEHTVDLVEHMSNEIDALKLPTPTTIQERCEQLQKINDVCTISIEELKGFSFNFSHIYLKSAEIQSPIIKKKILRLVQELYEFNTTFANICDHLVVSLKNIPPSELDQVHTALGKIPSCMSIIIEEAATELYGKLIHHKKIDCDKYNCYLFLTLNGTQIISATSDTITIWDRVTGSCIQKLVGTGDVIRCIAATSDAAQIIFGSGDDTVRIWNRKEGTCTPVLGGPDSASSLALTHDGKQLISGSLYEDAISIWDRETGLCIRVLHGHDKHTNYLVLTPDDKQIISGSNDRTIKVWDRETGICLKTLKGHSRPIDCLWLTPDGKQIISGSDDRTIRIWDRETGLCIRILKINNRENFNIDYSVMVSDGSQVISASMDKSIRIWQTLSFDALLAYLTLKNINPTQNFKDILDIHVLKNSQVFKTLSSDERGTLQKKIQKFLLNKQKTANAKAALK